MVELESVDYSIQDIPILRDIRLQVRAQETVAVLGASGSGKSTILRMILGLIRPDRGRVRVLDRDLETLTYAQLTEVRKHLGIVFQEGALFDSLTVGENVGYYFLEHERLSHQAVERRVRDMLSLVGLEHTMDMMPDELSGGMRRRVAIARAVIYEPSLLLYDEPTTGLDPVATDSILTLIDRLKKERRVASIVVTHQWEDAARVADRFVVIAAGRVAWQGSRSAFLRSRRRIVEDFFRAPGHSITAKVSA
jgi:phospholipid/cholesterol/gamma-HCH transport system ATP-binding protein